MVGQHGTILKQTSHATPVEKENISSLPGDFELYQNYPNPFNPTTTIKYHLPEPGNVTLRIYNLSDQEIDLLVDRYQSAGEYEIIRTARAGWSCIRFKRANSPI